MKYTPKILVFAGSTRAASFNKKLARLAADSAKRAGAEVTLIDLKDYPMPLFDQDLEASDGMPASAQKLKDLMVNSDGFIIAAPEYNTSITPLLKNTMDWVSRTSHPKENALIAYNGKYALIVSASPGALGGLRGLVTLRSILSGSGVWVVPGQLSVSKANEAFDENGALKDLKQAGQLDSLVKELVTTLTKIKN